MFLLNYLLEQDNEQLITLICQGPETIDLIINFMKSGLDSECSPALKAAGNICSSANSENIDLMLFHGLLDALDIMLDEHTKLTRIKEILWVVSNITAGTYDHCKAFL